ncbi:hypothetical protein GALL_483840 [mine drainage metagenome]|uniref:Uncharacterized protein n=1 Tax=mine drainage metagenome TaxID=410659 RepID=A0A1J5PFM6_9ZZZZ
MVVNMKQIKFTTQFAVITHFSFFKHFQMLLQIFLAGPSGAVNALQHFVFMITPPIGSCNFHQLEMLELAGAGYVWATAQVFEAAFTVETDIFIDRNAGNNFGFVMLAKSFEIGHGLITRQHPAQHRFVFVRQLGHAFFNLHEVVNSKRPLKRKIVKKTVFDYRTNGHLSLWKQLLDCISQQMRRGVANHLQPLSILAGNDRQRGISIDQITGIHRFAIHLACKCSFGQTRTNGCRNLGYRDGPRIVTLRTVRKGNLNHDHP